MTEPELYRAIGKAFEHFAPVKDPVWLNTEEAMEHLKIKSTSTFYKVLREAGIQKSKPTGDGMVRYNKRDLDRYMLDHMVEV